MFYVCVDKKNIFILLLDIKHANYEYEKWEGSSSLKRRSILVRVVV